MLSVRRVLGLALLALLVLLAALAILALPGPAHAAGCPDQPLARTFEPWSSATSRSVTAATCGWGIDVSVDLYRAS